MSAFRDGRCWHCGNALAGLEYGRGDTCPKCRRDTRVCKNCEFYDPGSHNDCRENQADRVVEKERSNFCDYFRPNPNAGSGAGTSAKDAARAAAEALFRKR